MKSWNIVYGKCVAYIYGRINKLIYSKDGLIRAAEVKTIPPKQNRTIIIKRPITKLYHVEMNKQSENIDGGNDDSPSIKFVNEQDIISFGPSGSVWYLKLRDCFYKFLWLRNISRDFLLWAFYLKKRS